MTFINTARYLVQARNTGGAWETHCTTHERAQAEALADTIAAQVKGVGLLHEPRTIPLYQYVRVCWRGSVVYDPREGGTT